MPLRYWREGGVAVVEFEGIYTLDAALLAMDEALGEEDEAAGGLLLDLTNSVSFRSRSVDGLRAIAEFLAARRTRFSSRLATVGASDLAFGLLRMGMVFVSDHGIDSEAFRSREEAMRWLGARAGPTEGGAPAEGPPLPGGPPRRGV